VTRHPSFAVIGNPIAHSLSPWIHQRFATQCGIALVYETMAADDASFQKKVKDFFANGGMGLNVTLPFKEQAYALAHKPTARATKARAANTLWMEHNQIYADNTDGFGFIKDINRFMDLSHKTILIVGAGGAARGLIQPILDAKPAQLIVANRSKDRALSLQLDAPEIICADLSVTTTACDLIINATSASLDGSILAISQACLAHKPLCYDLSYRFNEPTPFVLWAQSLKCTALDGLGMLVEQAAEAFYIWHHKRPETQSVLNVLRQHHASGIHI
jgi:shikimate dehydrogenase